MADDFDEEYGERSVEDHLKNGVDRDQYGTVFTVTTG